MKDIDQKALALAIAKLDKQFGKNSVFLGDVMPEEVDVISTGNFKMDIMLGVGGLPKGRIIEIFGGEGLGKSLLGLELVAACQRDGGTAGYVDAECDLHPEWAEARYVDMSKLYISQPEYGEMGLQVVIDLVATNAFDLIVIDSVAALTPKVELEGDMDDLQVGLQARMMAKGLRKMRQSVLETNTCVVFTNQIRDKIGFMSNGGTTSPGGRALKFYSSVRIELKKMGDIKDKKTGESRGTRVKANILKNKVGNPMKTLEYDIIHGEGFNNSGAILEWGEKYGLVKRNGAWYYLVDFETGEVSEKSFANGEESAIFYMKENPEWELEMANRIKEKMKVVKKIVEIDEAHD